VLPITRAVAARYYPRKSDLGPESLPVGDKGGSVGFLKRPPGEKRAPRSGDPVAQAIDELRHSGADPTMPHPTRHFIYVPGVRAAQRLARKLKTARRSVEIDPSARQGYWLVVVGQSMVVTPDAMAAIKVEFDTAAAEHGGAYDRWQVDLKGG
jgi:hypothetical protein